jgi:glucose/arabinose dehydrogenase
MTKSTLTAGLLWALFASTCIAQNPILSGSAAFGNWRQDRPGVTRKFGPTDIPPPKAGTDKETPDLNNHPRVVDRGASAPSVPPGFSVTLFASGLQQARELKVAPNGDVFVADSKAGQVVVFRPNGAGVASRQVFATGLNRPFGIAFYPSGTSPEWVYIGETGRIVRFPYRNGNVKARGNLQVIVPDIPTTHHWTRDVAVAPGGQTLLYSLGSGSNDGGDMAALTPDQIRAFAASHALGEAWGSETGRAEVREFSPDGKMVRPYVTGIRNCVAMAPQPGTDKVWCVVNERDALGNDTPPEYATALRPGAFYGWPWFYIGGHQDPRWPDARPDLSTKVTEPDVLIQAHTAPLGIAFYTGTQFPADYRGDAFITMHGSWDRTVRSGYKVVRLKMHDGAPTGEVEDFVTGFVVDDHAVWGRPVGVAVGQDGSLLVSEDGANTIWRVSATKR